MGGRLAGLKVRRMILVGLAAVGVAAGLTALPTTGAAYADIQPFKSTIKGKDGKDYWVENHPDGNAIKKSHEASRGQGKRPEYLIVWAGDENIADTVVGDVKKLPGSVLNDTVDEVKNALPGPDFLAVIDATEGSPTFGKVLNTGAVGPLVENEPHHMQYVWHKGEKIYAGGLYSAVTYVFDVSKLPSLSLSGITLPSDTLCGSVPDAYWVLKDGTAYGTYMGGPVAPGPCRYTHGEVRTGNGFAGTPGELVRLDKDGSTLVEAPAATTTAEDSKQCLNTPALSAPSCANPHGIQVREDLNTAVTSDFAEPRTVVLDPIKTPSPYLRRTTVRTWDITDRNHPKIKSVAYLPTGPRSDPDNPLYNENRAAMEVTVTNLPGHKGAFAETMQGAAIFYTPDITSPDPQWRQVFDNTTAEQQLSGPGTKGAGDNAAWIQTSPDDRTLYHSVQGRKAGTLGPDDPGSVGGVFTLDISKLVAAGTDYKCNIDSKEEIAGGGQESDCPTLKSTVQISPDEKAGGPHWGALDNLELGSDGYYHETDQPKRLATSNYFVARNGLDGDHKICILNIGKNGELSVDDDFKDEVTGETCVSFNRQNWPHGAFGNAKPHSMLFVTADEDIK